MDTLVTISVLDDEETRLLKELADVRTAKAVLRRVCGATDPPHGPTGLLPDVPETPGFVITAREATTAKERPGKPAPRPASDGSGANHDSDPREKGEPFVRCPQGGCGGTIWLIGGTAG